GDGLAAAGLVHHVDRDGYDLVLLEHALYGAPDPVVGAARRGADHELYRAVGLPRCLRRLRQRDGGKQEKRQQDSIHDSSSEFVFGILTTPAASRPPLLYEGGER